MVLTRGLSLCEHSVLRTALFQFLSKTIKYPVTAEKNKIQGRVIVGFYVEADGTVTDVQVKKSVDPTLDKEAVRPNVIH